MNERENGCMMEVKGSHLCHGTVALPDRSTYRGPRAIGDIAVFSFSFPSTSRCHRLPFETADTPFRMNHNLQQSPTQVTTMRPGN